ncbi:MAG: Acyl dehydratase, partial [uncultured Nocardioides sp.]
VRPHAHLHEPGPGGRRRRQRDRDQRLGRGRPGADRRLRRGDPGPPVDPRRRRGGRRGALRRHHRPRLPHPEPAPPLRLAGLLDGDPRGAPQLRPGEGPLPRARPGRQPAALPRALRRGPGPPGRQAAGRRAHRRDRGAGQAGVRRGARRPAPGL